MARTRAGGVWVGATAAMLLVAGCSVDGLLLGELTRDEHRVMPEPAAVILRGKAPGFQGAALRLWAGPTIAFSGKVDSEGTFALQTDGRSTLVGTVLEAQSGGRACLALVPELPAQTSVLNPERVVQLAEIAPGALEVGDVSTTAALVLLQRARIEGRELATIAPSSLVETLIDVDTRLRGGDPALTLARGAVQRVLSAGKAAPAAGAPFDPSPSALRLLRDAFAATSAVDADGNGAPDGDGAPFEAVITAAAAGVTFAACYTPGRIKVVLQVRLASDARDGNCEPIQPFLWADDKPGSQMFITGGVHKETPTCGAGRTAFCLQPGEIDAVNAALGNWVPNKVAMFDDGSHGDGAASDGIYTFAFEAPHWPAAAAPDGAGVRIAYKFTYGAQGQGWTGAEEFPGNQRILELDDRNNDHLIVRLDHFADETSNKDKANGLFTGCGKVTWAATAAAGCSSDSVERAIDLDGDCKVDGWPSAGKVAPLTVPCP